MQAAYLFALAKKLAIKLAPSEADLSTISEETANDKYIMSKVFILRSTLSQKPETKISSISITFTFRVLVPMNKNSNDYIYQKNPSGC